MLGVKRPPLAHYRVIEIEDVCAVAVLEHHFMDQSPGGVNTHGCGDLGPDQTIAVEGCSHHVHQHDVREQSWDLDGVDVRATGEWADACLSVPVLVDLAQAVIDDRTHDRCVQLSG